jgi:hypothetical protein
MLLNTSSKDVKMKITKDRPYAISVIITSPYSTNSLKKLNSLIENDRTVIINNNQ